MAMTRTLRVLILSAAFALGLATAPAAVAKVVRLPVSFDIKNVNGSVLPCPSDGAAYEVKGHLIGPASKLAPAAAGRHGSVTLYLHDFSMGESFWSFAAAPRYDYAAALARAGHVSVVIDRLGYGASGHPDGNQTCLGAQADIAHQIVGKLRSGDYVVEQGQPLRFDKVALAGHGVGGLIANLEAISFADVDALVAMSYSPQVTQRAFEQFYASREACLGGGEPWRQGGAGGYAFFARSDDDFAADAFHSADPSVVALAKPLRTPDPCGDGASLIDGLVRDIASLSKVDVPVLLVCGRDDAMTPAWVCPILKKRYVGSKDVSLYFVSNAGRALTLERSAPSFRRRVAAWLTGHGF
jgi:pimeloyl-ACP methyl ester carboxylesterase